MNPRITRAQMLLSQRRTEMAEKELGLALAEDPSDPFTHSLMALCLSEQEKFDPATHHARQAVAAAPDEGFPHYALAIVSASRKQMKEAEAAARQAIELDPHSSEYHELLAKIHASHNKWSEALESATVALECDAENTDAKNIKTLALRNLGKTDAARSEMLETLADDPDNALTHANLGWTLLQQGDSKQAMHHFREALRIDPELDWARAGVVETLKSRNIIYRLFFRYFMLMGRLTRGGQWKVVVGLWLLYIVLGELGRNVPGLQPWVTPLLILYVLFVLGSWLAPPLADLSLRLHPFGKLALSRSQRTASNWIGGILAATLVSGVTGVACGVAAEVNDVAALGLASIVLLHLAVYFGFMLLPFGAMFMAEWPQPRKALIGYTAVVGLMGVAFVVSAAMPKDEIPQLIAFGRDNFPLAAVLSLIAGNVLISIGWTK